MQENGAIDLGYPAPQDDKAKIKEDMAWLMATRRGRRVAGYFRDMAKHDVLSFSTNALTMAHNEGRRGVGLEIDAVLSAASFDSFILMLKETKEITDV